MDGRVDAADQQESLRHRAADPGQGLPQPVDVAGADGNPDHVRPGGGQDLFKIFLRVLDQDIGLVAGTENGPGHRGDTRQGEDLSLDK